LNDRKAGGALLNAAGRYLVIRQTPVAWAIMAMATLSEKKGQIFRIEEESCTFAQAQISGLLVTTHCNTQGRIASCGVQLFFLFCFINFRTRRIATKKQVVEEFQSHLSLWDMESIRTAQRSSGRPDFTETSLGWTPSLQR
jgi:hypothetical protein